MGNREIVLSLLGMSCIPLLTVYLGTRFMVTLIFVVINAMDSGGYSCSFVGL